MFKCQFRNADTVLEEVNMLAKLGNDIQGHVVLERQSAYLAKKPSNKAVSITAYLTKKPNNKAVSITAYLTKKPNNKAVSFTAYLTKKPNNKAISITTKQSSSQLVNQ